MDIKNKKGAFEADVERLVEKGMDNHEKDWKDKFTTKHIAKKEMLELKHRHKMESEDKNQTKKNWIEKIQEQRRKLKELELEEKRRKEEERKKAIRVKAIISIVLGGIGIFMMVIGSILGTQTGDPNSGYYAIAAVGFFPILASGFIWIDTSEKKKKK